MLVTAPLRGSALEELRDIADVVFDPAMVVADIKAILAGDKPVHCANPEVLK